MLRTQRSHIERFTRQISSVSTEPVASWCEEFGLKPDETSEMLKKTESDQILKEVRPQEVNSLVQAPGNDEPAFGNRLRKCIQNFETLEKEIQFTRVCENATIFHRVSV